MGGAYLDVEGGGNTAFVWGHVRGCDLYFLGLLIFCSFPFAFILLLRSTFAVICLPGHIVSIEVIILSTSSSLEIYGPHQSSF